MPTNKPILSDPRMRENYQRFLSQGSKTPLNVPGQDLNAGGQGVAGQMGKQNFKMTRPSTALANDLLTSAAGGSTPKVTDHTYKLQSSGQQVQKAYRNPSTEQGGVAPSAPTNWRPTNA